MTFPFVISGRYSLKLHLMFRHVDVALARVHVDDILFDPGYCSPDKKVAIDSQVTCCCDCSSTYSSKSLHAKSRTVMSLDESSLNAPSILDITLSSAIFGMPNKPLAGSP